MRERSHSLALAFLIGRRGVSPAIYENPKCRFRPSRPKNFLDLYAFDLEGQPTVKLEACVAVTHLERSGS